MDKNTGKVSFTYNPDEKEVTDYIEHSKKKPLTDQKLSIYLDSLINTDRQYLAKKYNKSVRQIYTDIQTVKDHLPDTFDKDRATRILNKLADKALKGLEHHLDDTSSRDNYNAIRDTLKSVNVLTKDVQQTNIVIDNRERQDRLKQGLDRFGVKVKIDTPPHPPEEIE